MKRILKEINDKFYTKDECVEYFLSKIDYKKYDLVIEPSAGNGAFFNKINHNKIGLDILPETQNIIKQDWFSFNEKLSNNVLVIGNPPFGKNGSLALKFIKKCDELKIKTIAFILPKSFKKLSFKNKIPLNYILSYEEDVVKDSFLLNGEKYDVPCIFQIWERNDVKRNKIETKTVSNLFNFVKINENPDFSVRRVGFYAGKLYDDINKSIESHYFIKNNNILDLDKLKNIIKSIDWEHNNTTGARSISKHELIFEIEKRII